jgi:hypothetical protein
MSLKASFFLLLTALLSVGSEALLRPSLAASSAGAQSQGETAAGQAAIAKSIGVVKAINGNAITLAPASGPEVAVTVQPTARILRLAPGDKDLKNATPLQLQDLQVGDTIRARGFSSDGAKSIAALEIIVITRAAVAAVSDQIRQDWQKRGVGGLVSAVDPAAATVTVSVAGFAGTKTIVVHTSKATVFRRYSPDSVKFDEARPSALQEVHPGDQLRARGERSADGAEFTAEEIVTGRFRNIAGTVSSVDASAGTVTVQDVLSKKTLQAKVTPDSQLHKLPPEVAQRMAMRFKAMLPGAQGVGGGSWARAGTPAGSGQTTPPVTTAPGGGMRPGGAGMGGPGMGGAMRSGGAPDFQQMLSHMPAVTLADLHKGDAVMMVATEGSTSNTSTAITLLSGVEPILEAAPSASQAMMLTPWNLEGAPSGDGANP